jgi:putative transposase
LQDKKAQRKKAILGWIQEVMIELPFYGYRKISEVLKEVIEVTKKQIRRVMNKYGLKGLRRKKKTSICKERHKKYPYLLRGYEIRFPNQVWSTDITYIKVGGRYLYMTVIVDVHSRKVLSWRISNSMEKEFCISALEEALDNIYIERFWKTLKYEDIKFKYYVEVSDLKEGVANFIRFYNHNRFHQSLEYKTPDEVYYEAFSKRKELVA